MPSAVLEHFHKFLDSLKAASRVFIQTHDFLDPDAIASAYGLRSLLRIMESRQLSATTGK